MLVADVPAPSMFSRFVDEEVIVVYKEDNIEKSVQGILEKDEPNFILVDTDAQKLIINKSFIVKLKVYKNTDGDERWTRKD